MSTWVRQRCLRLRQILRRDLNERPDADPVGRALVHSGGVPRNGRADPKVREEHVEPVGAILWGHLWGRYHIADPQPPEIPGFFGDFPLWRPVGDSNPCYRRERAVS